MSIVTVTHDPSRSFANGAVVRAGGAVNRAQASRAPVGDYADTSPRKA